jgi:hypothetical protein
MDLQQRLTDAIQAHRDHRDTCRICSRVGTPGSSAYPCTFGQVLAGRVDRLAHRLASAQS